MVAPSISVSVRGSGLYVLGYGSVANGSGMCGLASAAPMFKVAADKQALAATRISGRKYLALRALIYAPSFVPSASGSAACRDESLPACHNSTQHFGGRDLLWINLQQILVEDHQIGQVSWGEPA